MKISSTRATTYRAMSSNNPMPSTERPPSQDSTVFSSGAPDRLKATARIVGTGLLSGVVSAVPAAGAVVGAYMGVSHGLVGLADDPLPSRIGEFTGWGAAVSNIGGTIGVCLGGSPFWMLPGGIIGGISGALLTAYDYK
jgi:hypothetical protein